MPVLTVVRAQGDGLQASGDGLVTDLAPIRHQLSYWRTSRYRDGDGCDGFFRLSRTRARARA